ncbi:MAG TPA: hypothetical protein PK710_21825, partial [Polyangiaceae bacterium]|nr:hypothetical protein [Polyangiaceae bacterium]
VQRGARLRLIDGKPVFYDRFVPLTLGPSAVNSVLASAHVRRIRSGPTHPLLLPLDHSAELIGLEGARGARPALDRLTGKGMLVADLDSNADVFHPQFFHADAGWFDWIDVNANGVFEPGIDAIDLDGDGIVGASETASWLKARTLSLHWGDEVPARDDVFDPAIDWVYFDENGNQQRDYGVDQGFDDSTPAFGEPIFVPDDVNRNGKIDVGERFVRLGTSKFKKSMSTSSTTPRSIMCLREDRTSARCNRTTPVVCMGIAMRCMLQACFRSSRRMSPWWEDVGWGWRLKLICF